MKTHRFPFPVFALTVTLVMCAVVPVLGQDKRGNRICGAGLLSDVVEAYYQDYSRTVLDCGFTISGANTGVGFKKLVDGEAEIAMMTRKATPDELTLAETKGVPLSSKLVGQIGLAVITNSKNTVNELTMDQLIKVFKGEVTNWSDVGGPNEPIKVTIRAVPETGAGVLFQEAVLKGASYSKDAQVMNSYATTVQVCGKSFAIGYIPTTTVYFDRLAERGAKILKIKKDDNSQAYTLSSGVTKNSSYPISVDFILYWNSKLENQCTKGFADFCDKQAR